MAEKGIENAHTYIMCNVHFDSCKNKPGPKNHFKKNTAKNSQIGFKLHFGIITRLPTQTYNNLKMHFPRFFSSNIHCSQLHITSETFNFSD